MLDYRTFGKVEVIGDRIVCECEPQVLIRAKRIFDCAIKKGTGSTFSITATPNNCREFLWFIERYPLDMDLATASRIQRGKSTQLANEAAVANILAEDYVPPKFNLAEPPYPFQAVAADLLGRTGRLLLADDVGLGKTVSAIAGLKNDNALPALVVAPTHMPFQWRDMINRFAPELSVYIVRDGKPIHFGRRYIRGIGKKHPDVILINYHKLAKWQAALIGNLRSIVFDECQDLRCSGSQKYHAAEVIAAGARYKLGASATPIYNYGGEIFNVLETIAPGELGTREEVMREWCSGCDDKARINDPRAFGSYLREVGLMLRRTRAEVGRELPPLTKVPYEIDADLREIEKVKGRANELASIILSNNTNISGFDKMKAGEELDWRLRQATGIAKAPFIAEFIRLLVESGEHPVLYAWHREVYSILMERLRDLNPVLYTGSESPTQKEHSKQAFISGESKVLIMSLRSGQGVDGLQYASRVVVIGELDWSPGIHEQIIGRVYRDGQPDPVIAYFLISDHGSDPILVDVCGLKKQQIDGIREPHAIAASEQIDPNHIKRLAEDFLKRNKREYFVD